jgi:hypothetical protein
MWGGGFTERRGGSRERQRAAAMPALENRCAPLDNPPGPSQANQGGKEHKRRQNPLPPKFYIHILKVK